MIFQQPETGHVSNLRSAGAEMEGAKQKIDARSTLGSKT